MGGRKHRSRNPIHLSASTSFLGVLDQQTHSNAADKILQTKQIKLKTARRDSGGQEECVHLIL